MQADFTADSTELVLQSAPASTVPITNPARWSHSHRTRRACCSVDAPGRSRDASRAWGSYPTVGAKRVAALTRTRRLFSGPARVTGSPRGTATCGALPEELLLQPHHSALQPELARGAHNARARRTARRCGHPRRRRCVCAAASAPLSRLPLLASPRCLEIGCAARGAPSRGICAWLWLAGAVGCVL